MFDYEYLNCYNSFTEVQDMNSKTFLLLIPIFSAIVSILKYVLRYETAIKLDTWYGLMDKDLYDFEVTLKREKRYFPMLTLISIVGYVFTLYTNNIVGNIFVCLALLFLFFNTFYTRPTKIYK